MNYSPMVLQVVSSLWYLIPLAILLAMFKSPWFKGWLGELIVNLSARLFLDKNHYHLIKNVTLPTDDGTTQIDHIIVSIYGVYVVETKNMKGWIYGSSKQKTWTQKIYKHSSKFQNPLHQNFKHTQTLASLLELEEGQVHSVIVFIGNNTFKTEMPENVTRGGGYIRYIKSKKAPVLTESDVKEIIQKVQSNRLVRSFKTNSDHVRHVKNIIAEKENVQYKAAPTAPKCPKCSSVMVARVVKKGQHAGRKFWGCSNFPKCRGIVG